MKKYCVSLTVSVTMLVAAVHGSALAADSAPAGPVHPVPALPSSGPSVLLGAPGEGGGVQAVVPYDCDNAAAALINIGAAESIVEIVLENDPANIAGPNSERIRWRTNGANLATIVSFRACEDVFITSGEGDELVTIKALDPGSAVTRIIVRTQGYDASKPSDPLFDEPGDDHVVIDPAAPPIDYFIEMNNGNDFLEVAPFFTGTLLQANGGAGSDRLTGGSGDDFFYGEGGSDTIIARGGIDQALGGPGDDTINLGGGNDLGHGDAGDDDIRGGAGQDTLRGGSGEDDLQGQGAIDTIFGDGDDDTIDGQNGADTLLGGAGNDIIRGQTGPDDLRGGGGDDNLSGGNGNDTLAGDAGFDRCSGNTGPADAAQASSCEQTPGVELFY